MAIMVMIELRMLMDNDINSVSLSLSIIKEPQVSSIARDNAHRESSGVANDTDGVERLSCDILTHWCCVKWSCFWCQTQQNGFQENLTQEHPNWHGP